MIYQSQTSLSYSLLVATHMRYRSN